MKVLDRSPLWRRIVRRIGLKLFQLSENNGIADSTRNGEAALIDLLIRSSVRTNPHLPFVAIDAGANEGSFTSLLLGSALQHGCAVNIYAIEPSPVAAAGLRQRLADGAVSVVCAALSDRVGKATLYAGAKGSTQASLIRRRLPHSTPPSHNADPVTVELMRLDDYCNSLSLKRFDFVKLDVEGSELAALKGFGRYLHPDVISAIQFEYGGTTLDAGASLRDLYDLLTSAGYVLSKLLPGALEIRPYHHWMEHYDYANYVAMSPERLATLRL